MPVNIGSPRDCTFSHRVSALCYLRFTSEIVSEFGLMPTLRLTARTVNALKADPDHQVDYCDESLPGFVVRVSKFGKKSWCVVYRHAGKVRRLTLDSYPPITIADARDMARDALRDAQKGSDPAAQKRAERRAESFADLADAFIERYLKKKKKSWREDQRIIDAYLKPL
jgi:hypothetical protein